MTKHRKGLIGDGAGIVAACGQAAAHISRPDFHTHLLDTVGSLVAHDIRSMMRYSRFSAPDFLANNSYSDAFVASQLKGIVGIEIEISAIEGKFKASQNRPEADRAGVAEGLLEEGEPHSAAMRELVKQRGGV